MATNINTNVAQELNITHRKNDSFELEVNIRDSETGLSFNLSEAQIDSVNFMNSQFPNAGVLPKYQAKMTIKKRNSQHETLNLHTFFWRDNNLTNIEPTAIQTGRYYGENSGTPFIAGAGNQSSLYAGIYLYDSTGSSADENIVIKAPNEYMSFDAGDYIYDLQIRRKDNYSTLDVGAVYTTWLFGTFKLTEDVTQI
tara:strand:+ start:302 stop:892 length:591 start_codon:yes stop_codon:yes gene_type:complete